MKVELVLLISGMLLSAGFSQAQEETPSELSNTRVATVDLKIITDPKVLPLQERAFREVFGAQRLYDAGKGYAAEDNSSWFSDMHDSPIEIGGAQVLRIQWSISLGQEDKPAAKEIAENLVDGLRDYLHSEYAQNMSVFSEKEHAYMQRASQADRQLRQLIDERNKLGQDALDETSFRQRAQERQRELMENQMQRSVLTKRTDQLKRNIEQLKAMKNYSPEGSSGDAEAERERQRRLDDEIARLDREHRNTLIELEEQNVRINVLNGMSPGNISVKYELLGVQIEAARENLKTVLIEKAAFETQMALIQRPVVIDEIHAVMPASEAVSQAR